MAAPMTDLDTGPSSIRDDSICESSLPPNKSSGDIGERTWTPEQFWEFATAFLGDHEATTSRTMIEDRGLVLIPAAEIERLRREVEQWAAQSLKEDDCRKSWQARALAAESSLSEAVKAAREDEREGCALVAENAYTGRTNTGIHPLQIARAIRSRAAVLDSERGSTHEA